MLGWLATANNNWPDFIRFYRAITPESFYSPTARQVAALVEARHDPQKILVILGGSSIIRGNGQRVDKLWSRSLQADLGERYVVLNLGINGEGPSGPGSYMLEMAHKRGWPVIYVGDYGPMLPYGVLYLIITIFITMRLLGAILSIGRSETNTSRSRQRM